MKPRGAVSALAETAGTGVWSSAWAMIGAVNESRPAKTAPARYPPKRERKNGRMAKSPWRLNLAPIGGSLSQGRSWLREVGHVAEAEEEFGPKCPRRTA